MSEESLVALMIGRPLQLAFPERHDARSDREVLLAVSGLRGERFGPIDLEVAKGEIVGIAGAEGNGQVPFLRALAGAERAPGAPPATAVSSTPARRSARCGRGRPAERRPDRGSSLSRPQRAANSTIQTCAGSAASGFLNRRRERVAVDALAQRLSVRMASISSSRLVSLGRDQQKVSWPAVPARERQRDLAEEPTGRRLRRPGSTSTTPSAKGERRRLRSSVKSSDPLEARGALRHAWVVISRGRIVDENPRLEDLGERRIVEAIVGARAAVAEKPA
jgi:ABC-type sugar transport system ATPase subunit